MKAHLLKALFLLSILFTGIHSTKAQCTDDASKLYFMTTFAEWSFPNHPICTSDSLKFRIALDIFEGLKSGSFEIRLNDITQITHVINFNLIDFTFDTIISLSIKGYSKPYDLKVINYYGCDSDTSHRVFGGGKGVDYFDLDLKSNLCLNEDFLMKKKGVERPLSFAVFVNNELKSLKEDTIQEVSWYPKWYSLSEPFEKGDSIRFVVDEGGIGCPTYYEKLFVFDKYRVLESPKISLSGDQPSTVGKGQVVNFTISLKDTLSTDKIYWQTGAFSKEYQKAFTINSEQIIRAIVVPECGLNDTATAYFDVYTKNVEGVIYNDANGNCVQDAGEEPLPHLLFKVNNQAQHLFTDNSGYYFASLPIGTHSLQFFDRSDYLIDSVCNTNFTINSGASNVQKPIGLQLKKISNVGINGGCTRVRPGMLVTTNVNLYNVGAFDEDAVVKLLPDTLLTLRSTSPEYDYMLGDTLVWEMSLMKNEFKKIILNFDVRLDLSIVNRSIHIYANIYTPNDAVLDNNERFISARITNSFDPNDKYLLPGEVFDSLSQKLTYRVRFQNTGTDTAFNIVVRDTMPAGLDLSTFELGAASHPFDFFIEDQNVLYWKFMNIQLPDSTIDEAGSHGYFYFTIEPSKNLALYDTVFNEADIYFDFNPPVITNNSMARYGEKVAVHLEPSIKVERIHLYPNPVVQQIRLEGNSVGGYDIIDAKGRMVQSGVAADNVIKVDQLPSGIYFLQLHDADRSIQFLKQ